MTLKVAILGTGRVARDNYLPFLASQKDVELSYFSRTASKARDSADTFGGRLTNSIEELTADDPHVVFVLTNERQRFEAASALLKQCPRRVFFEKPLVAQQGQDRVTEEDFFNARALINHANAAGTETAMIFNYRFFDQVQASQRAVKERGLGPVIHCSGLVHFACWSHCIDLIHLFAGPIASIVATEG